jgi:asparaginyl-tRNA synthetase
MNWHLLRHRGASFSYARTLSLCRPRCSSTYRPTNIAELLRPSPLSSSAQRAPLDGETLIVNGYVRTVRKQKRVAFAAIGDGSTLKSVQAVLAPQLAEGLVDFFQPICTLLMRCVLRLSTGVAVTFTGTWTPSRGQEQSHELQVSDVRILGENDATVR